MSAQVLWSQVVPASIAVVIAMISLLSTARFLRRFVRARDWGGVAGASCGLVIMGGFLFVAVHTIAYPPLV